MLTDFLKRLQRNNNRPWFQQHKDEYEALRSRWIADLQRMIDAMAAWDPAMARVDARQAAYRIYRDTRFSLDKTPYKTYFSASISPYGRTTHRAAYYLQVDARPEETGLYAGMWCPEPWMLAKERHAIVDNIEEWEEIIGNPALKRWRWVGQSLKTAPKGWDRNHPCAQWLRLKDYGLFLQMDPAVFDGSDWPVKAAAELEALKPFVDFLNYNLDEEAPFTL